MYQYKNPKTNSFSVLSHAINGNTATLGSYSNETETNFLFM